MSVLLESNETAWPLLSRGKVRDIYDFGPSELLIVTTDRLSAFDVILPTGIPDKGVVLTQISNFWFGKLSDIIPNHLVDPEPFGADGKHAHLAGNHGKSVSGFAGMGCFYCGVQRQHFSLKRQAVDCFDDGGALA